MRQALVSLFTAFLLLSGITFAQEGEEIVSPGWNPKPSSRFAPSPAQQYLVFRARAEAEHQTAILHAFDAAGIDYGRPYISGGPYWVVQPPMRTRRVYAYQGGYYHSFGLGF